jgi:hypothetical protein
MHVIIRAIQLNTHLEDLSLDRGSIAIDIAIEFGFRSAREHNHPKTETTLAETCRYGSDGSLSCSERQQGCSGTVLRRKRLGCT